MRFRVIPVRDQGVGSSNPLAPTISCPRRKPSFRAPPRGRFPLDTDARAECILPSVEMQRVRLLIQGRVQGVGFRYFACHRARALGLTGTVRNRPDGELEVDVEGDSEKLTQFVEAMRQGPRGAHVSHVEETWSEGPARHRDFTITA